MQERVLVTGSAGFIGQHLVRRLADAGYHVTGLDLKTPAAATPGVENITCDMLDVDALHRAFADVAPEVVLHLAAITHLDGTTLVDYAANIDGVANLAAVVAQTRSVRRVICTSTQLVHRIGTRPPHNLDYDPSTMYGASKVQTEQIWRAADGAGREWCLVRPTTIWGPGMNPHYLRFFRMIESGRYVHVSSGPVLKTYGFVGNTTCQYQRLLEAPAASVHRKTFYLGDYEPLEIGDWAERFRVALGAPPIRRIPMAAARAVARVGDVVNRLGAKRFPFNSFRLTNVITPNVVDLEATAEVCGPVPFTMPQGVEMTADWLRTVGIGARKGRGTSLSS